MRQLLVLFVLVLLMNAAANHGLPTPDGPFDSLTLVTTGFILIGAYAMGELFRRMRLPALLGYLATGMLFGPKLAAIMFGTEDLAPIGGEVIPQLALINVLAVGVIGTMGGGEIKLSELRENFTKLAAVCGVVFVLVLPTVAGLVLGLTFVAPSWVPFLSDLPVGHRIAGALLFGALAVGMSPAATLALLQEVRAHGKFTSLVLGIVVLGDLVLVATFLLILALAKLLISPEGLTWPSLLEQLPHIAAEFGWAMAIGVLVGLLFILYLRFVRVQILLFSLAVVFVTSFVATRLHAETLLAFLVGGFIVQNFSRHGHTLVEAFERISLPVFIIYFTTQAAALDLVSVTVYLPLTLLLVAVRVGLFIVGVGFGARRAGVDDVTRRHLQGSFFSQGGVDLVLAAMVAEAIPEWGPQVQTVTVATILFYVIGGPPFLARALDAMGESEAARERGTEDLKERTRARGKSAFAAGATRDLVAPQNEDPILRRRLIELHHKITDLRDRILVGQILGRARKRHQLVEELTSVTAQALEGAATPEVAAARCAELDAAFVAAGRKYSHALLAPFDGKLLAEFLFDLDAAQPFGESHRVVRTADLFIPSGNRLSRFIRAMRRLRRSVAGPGFRTVPIGRLWRYHVSLEVPVVLWSTTAPAEAEIWHALLHHYRVTRAHLVAICEDKWANIQLHAPSTPHDHASEEEAEPDVPDFQVWLAEATEQAQKRQALLEKQLTDCDDELEEGLLLGLSRAWAGFVGSVELAGTLERPAWRYRPSSRYDLARAATAELLERGSADRERAAGRYHALLALTNARNVARAIRISATEFEERFAAVLGELDADFDAALGLSRRLRDNPGDAVRAGRELGAGLGSMATHVDRLRRHLASLAMLESVALRKAMLDCPDSVEPSSEIATDDDADDGDARRTPIRLKAWLSQTIVQNFSVTRAAAENELATGLANLRQALSHVGRVVEYHVGHDAAARQGRLDEGLGDRIAGLLERAREQVRELNNVAKSHVEEKIVAAEHASLSPIVEHRWDDIRRRHRRLEDSPRAAIIEWLREHQQSLLARLRHLGHRLTDETTALFAARPTEAALISWRTALLGQRSLMPEPYQRLFTSVPAETMGSLVTRPELTRLADHVERWFDGRGGPALVYGDRGAGKRTLVRQLLVGLGERADVQWLRLSPRLESERHLVEELTPWFGLPTVSGQSLTTLLQRVQALTPATWQRAELSIEDVDGVQVTHDRKDGRRLIVVVENCERLFRRNPDGLLRIRQFMDFIAATSDHVLWIVLMAEPAVQVLDPAVELRARFSGLIHVPPMTADQLEQVLEIRHRLSGYGVRLEPGVPGIAGWLRRPGTAWRLWRGHSEATFERLAQLSGGNVRQAMRLWLAAARIDPQDTSTVVIGPLPVDPCTLLDELPISSRVLLAALMLHGPLPHSDLAELHRQHSLDLDGELARLANLGLVRIEGDADGLTLVSVETRLIQPLTSELRTCNLL